MSDQSKLGIGKIITTEQGKDAIHVAVAPVTAACRLHPGDHVGLDSAGLASDDSDGNDIGVVDPFLIYPVKKGERFWLFLYPGSITSLAHVWTHPSFPETERATGAIPDQEGHNLHEAWLREWVQDNCRGLSFEETMQHAHEYCDTGYMFGDGYTYEGIEVPNRFWDHFFAFTGKSPTSRESFFTCSC